MTMKSTVPALWLAMSLIAASLGCATPAAPAPRGPELAVLEHDATLLTSPEWLEDHLGDPRVVILHVTDREDDYTGAHIPGARHLDWAAVTERARGSLLPPAPELAETFAQHGLQPGQRVVLYDGEGGTAAAQAWLALDYLGLAERASLLDGQLAAWRFERRPLEAGPPPTATYGNVRPAIHGDTLVALPAFQELVRQQAAGRPIVLVDARAPAAFERAGETGSAARGEGGSEAEDEGARRAAAGQGGPGEGAAGQGAPPHVPGAVNIPWWTNLVSEREPVFRPVTDLRLTWAAHGVDPRELVVVYGGGGGAAALAYFTARYLGYDALVFDGTYAEWAQAIEAAGR